MGQGDQINKAISKLKEGTYSLFDEDDSNDLIEALPEIESKLNLKFPKDYTDFIKEVRGRYFENSHFNIGFFGKNGMKSYNVGKDKKRVLKDYFAFALGTSSLLFFMDVKNLLGKGENAIFVIDWNSKHIKEARYLAKDFVELFEIVINNRKLNEKPIG